VNSVTLKRNYLATHSWTGKTGSALQQDTNRRDGDPGRSRRPISQNLPQNSFPLGEDEDLCGAG
jgi:hypothetical protein